MGLGSCRRRRSSSYCRSLAHSRTQTTHGPGPDHRSQPGTCRSLDFGTTGTALRPQSAGHKPSPLSAQRPGRAPVRLRLQRAPDDPSSSAAPRPHTRRRPQRKIPPPVRLSSTAIPDRRSRRPSQDFVHTKRRRPVHAKLRSVRQLCKPSDSQNRGDST